MTQKLQRYTEAGGGGIGAGAAGPWFTKATAGGGGIGAGAAGPWFTRATAGGGGIGAGAAGPWFTYTAGDIAKDKGVVFATASAVPAETEMIAAKTDDLIASFDIQFSPKLVSADPR
jgi:hypothetical protein